MAELLEQLEIPFYVVGAGIQDELKAGDASQISQSVMDMMKVVDKKAALFGVRGVHTKSWLNSVGFESPQAIGCPSMFAYPRNILAIKSPSHYDLILTAGHMLTGASQKERALTLIRGFKGHRPSYVFQGEPKNYTDLLDVPGLWNDAAQTLDRAAVSRYLTAKLGIEVPFRRYFSFTESSAWRVAANQHQLYVGDRIHGGVAAMQVGRPAIVLYSDARVNELAEHHGIPACELGEFGKIGVDAAVSQHLSEERIEQFHLKYVNSLSKFYEAVEGAGLEIADRILIPSNLLKKSNSKPGFVASALKKIRKVA
uniref:Polysaccharide pyruvyl transferase domain-containing protein n=2 Tax=Aureimonas frigidaquae TaxID=424757 RepID=A0A0P0Z2B5_9HYPH|nr:hypothetical protein [Aureimonas frigidaquae]